VKYPFLIHMNPAGPRTELAPDATLRVTRVQVNMPIEASRLAKPESRPAPAR
jgi:hypothetical protein